MSGTAAPRREFPSAKSRKPNRQGTILVLAAVMMVVMVALLALSVDLGYITTVNNELQRATDAAALAGAGSLVEGTDEAQLQAFKFLARNPVGGRLIAEQEGWEEQAALWIAQHPDEFKVEAGHWNPDNPKPEPGDTEDPRFIVSDQLPSTVRVQTAHNNTPLFFAKLLGRNSFSVKAESIARYQPRDISVVLDFSGSMNYDSQLMRITNFGETARAAVEASLLECYQDLDSPAYGTLQFTPQYVTLEGQAASGCIPHVTVTFRGLDVQVTSTKDLSNVVLQFSNGWTQRFEGLSGTTGTFKGTGYYAGKRIDKVWVKSGCNDSYEGTGYGERFEDTAANIKQYFGLTSVPYPYASGSWDDYINYVKTNSYVKTAGYMKKYGFMTLINYWLEQKAGASETADLWKVSAQPIATVKDCFGVFMGYLQEVDIQDRVAFTIYNSPSQDAQLEQGLTEDFALVQNLVQHRQAGHYDRYTNIGAGIRVGREELDAHGRAGAFKMIVLMTDGNANKPSNESTARTYALDQARAVAVKGYPILAISLGDDADSTLMQEIADITGGIHFNVPGGQTVTDYQTGLLAVLRQIADHRPLVLVK
jgi:hypothetical protein